MAYSTPRTWTPGELVTAALMNTYVRDTQTALKTPPQDLYNALTSYAGVSVSSTSFVQLDATNLTLSLTTVGGPVLIMLHCNLAPSSTGDDFFIQIKVDGNAVGEPTVGFGGVTVATGKNIAHDITFVVDGLSAGAHTVTVFGKVSGGNTIVFQNVECYIREF